MKIIRLIRSPRVQLEMKKSKQGLSPGTLLCEQQGNRRRDKTIGMYEVLEAKSSNGFKKGMVNCIKS